MPLILTQNEITLSGHDYADEFGLTYEYPTTYRARILQGERFVYYRGRRTVGGPNRPQVYLGHGRIGVIESAPEGRLRCSIDAYVPFPAPLSFKLGDAYLEPAATAYGTKAGLYFRAGVRVVPATVYDEMVSLGMRDRDPTV